MSKAIRSVKLTDNLTMSECKDGYWLHDYTRGMNLSMRAKTQEDAFVESLTYYQKRTKNVEEELRKLKQSVSDFVNSLSNEDDDEHTY
jgi:hypothetical protein